MSTTETPEILAWAQKFLPDYFVNEPAPFHAELFSDLAADKNRLIARAAPRGHAKSTCAALAYPLWCICEKKRQNIVIITHESSLAKQFLADIRRELESNDRLRAAYGDLCRDSRKVPEDTGSVREAAPKAGRLGEAAPETSILPETPTAAKPTSPPRKKSTATKGRAGRGTPRPASRAVAPRADSETPTAPKPSTRKPRPKPPAPPVLPIDAAPPSAEFDIRNSPFAIPSRPPKRWTSTHLTTSTGITIQAKGAGAGFRGVRVGPNRPDLIICDDLEKDDHVASPEQRQKLERWLRRVVMPALAPDGRLVVLGSIIHHDSLLANLANPERFPGWQYKVYRAIEAEPTITGEFRRVALWPARWPLERLDEERARIGSVAFEQEYQANPIDDGVRVFRPEWLRRYDPAEIEHKKLTHLIAVDPATGKSGGDFFALWIGGVDPATGVIYTRVLELSRIGIVAQVRRILAAFEEWRPAKIGIETVAYQAALKEILEDESRKRGLYMPIVSIHHTADKVARIEGSSVFFENGLFRLPPVLDAEAEMQFLQFPKARHDDAPDVCAMAIDLARTLRAGRISGMTPSTNAARPPDPNRNGHDPRAW